MRRARHLTILLILFLLVVYGEKTIGKGTTGTMKPCGTCCTGVVKRVITWIKAEYPDVYIHSIRIGDSLDSDRHYSYFDDANRQLKEVCDRLRSDENLKDGFNLLGLSQGGLMSRALVHRCGSDLKVHRLITMGSPLQGTIAYPGCGMRAEKGWFPTRKMIKGVMRRLREAILTCQIITAVVGRSIYTALAQSRVMPAQYYKDPTQLDAYFAMNSFLSDINNERSVKNPIYKENFIKLDRLVVYSFTDENIVHPRESTNFGFTDGKRIIPMRELPMYTEDWIGLQELDKRNAIYQIRLPGDHLDIPRHVVINLVYDHLMDW